MLPPSWKAEVQKSIEVAASAERDQREAGQSEAGANIAAAIHALRHTQTAQANSEDSNEKKNQGINKATLVLVAFTALFTGLSWFVFRDQARIAKEAADDAHIAYTAVQRAFITISDVVPTPIYDPDSGKVSHWTLRMNFENSGNTPTVDFRVIPGNTSYPVDQWQKAFPGVRQPDAPNDPEIVWGSLKSGGRYTYGLVGPHAKFPLTSFGIPLDGTDGGIAGIFGGESRAFTFGSIHYRDIFKGSSEHVRR
jgi:hypothetical protein